MTSDAEKPAKPEFHTLGKYFIPGQGWHVLSSEGGSFLLTFWEELALKLRLTSLERLDAKHRKTPYTFGLGDQVRHAKTEGIYVITGLPNVNMIEATGEPAYLYRKLDGVTQFSRSRTLMEDGRFYLLYEGTRFPFNLF